MKALLATLAAATAAVILIPNPFEPDPHGSADLAYRANLTAIAPCAISMAVARAEDDLCAIWLDGDDQHVVVGPLHARPADA